MYLRRFYKYLPLIISCLYPSVAMAATGDMYCIMYSLVPIYIFFWTVHFVFFMFVPYWHIKSCITQNKTIKHLTRCKVSII